MKAQMATKNREGGPRMVEVSETVTSLLLYLYIILKSTMAFL